MMTLSFRRPWVLALLALAIAGFPPLADAMAPEPDHTPQRVEDSDYERAVALIWAEEYAAAEPLLQAAVKRNGRNPDAWNYLGFVHRKLGNFSDAQSYYFNALRLDPEHLQAMEYLGELYLQTGQPELARELLGRLEALCPAECEARDMLAAAIKRHSATN